MPSRSQIVCLHEGAKGRSIDPIFIRVLLRTLNPTWIRPWPGNNVIRAIACGGRSALILKVPAELRACLRRGGDTTLMVWADLDHDMESGHELKDQFWATAQQVGVTKAEFDKVVFIFAKDRLENWIEFLLTGATDESVEGPREASGKKVEEAARVLATKCLTSATIQENPPSLAWSCQNWRDLVNRMRT